MERTLNQFKALALENPEVREEYDQLAKEFALLEALLKARAVRLEK